MRCSEESLDNINAALLSAEKLLEINAQPDRTDSTKKPRKLSLMEVEALISEEELNNETDGDQTAYKTSTDHNNTLKAMPNDNSCKRSGTNNMIEIDLTDSNDANEKFNSSLSTLSTVELNKKCVSSTTVNCTSELGPNASDTAFLIIPSISDQKVDVSFSHMTLNDNIRHFILEGGMIESDDENIEVYNPNEIDEIVDDVILFGVHYYLVKWRTWSRGFNTWERFNALYKAQNVVYDYVLKKHKTIGEPKPINGIHHMLSRKIVSELFNLFRNQTGLSLPSILPDDLASLFNSLDIGGQNIQFLRKKSFKWYLRTIALNNYRQEQLFRLKLWEIDINVMTLSHEIKVENNIDLQGPPDFFVYTLKYIPSANIIIPNDPPIGCSCRKNCANSIGCCSEMSGYSAVYNANKIITKAPGYPIYECNKKCKCTSDCHNRVVQHGSKVNICIYKTKTCGWGVKTIMNIKKGQFVAKYVGEIVTVEESEQRLENNTSLLDYMWNLDFDDPQNYKYIIDGTHYANFTYFINHSCNANLNVYAVWINCLDRNLPELALFASRDIFAGEQLTTDYFTRTTIENQKSSGIKCQCNMKNCKGYYF